MFVSTCNVRSKVKKSNVLFNLVEESSVGIYKEILSVHYYIMQRKA